MKKYIIIIMELSIVGIIIFCLTSCDFLWDSELMYRVHVVGSGTLNTEITFTDIWGGKSTVTKELYQDVDYSEWRMSIQPTRGRSYSITARDTAGGGSYTVEIYFNGIMQSDSTGPSPTTASATIN